MNMMKKVPVLMMTSSNNRDEADRARELGAKGYVVKGNALALEDIVSFAASAKADPNLWIEVGVQ